SAEHSPAWGWRWCVPPAMRPFRLFSLAWIVCAKQRGTVEDRKMADEIPETPQETGNTHPAIRAYTVVCLAALLVVAVLLTQEGSGIFGLLPVLVGAGALLARWSIGPPLVFFLVGGFYLSHYRPHRTNAEVLVQGELLSGLLLAAVLIVYV